MGEEFLFDASDISEWLDLSTEDFIIALTRYLNHQALLIKTNAELIHRDNVISSIPQSELTTSKQMRELVEKHPSNKMRALYEANAQGTVHDLTSGILSGVENIVQITAAAQRFADLKKKMK